MKDQAKPTAGWQRQGIRSSWSANPPLYQLLAAGLPFNNITGQKLINDSYNSAKLQRTCFFLSCKVNARVKLAKTGHGQHSSTLVVICVVRLLFVLFYVLFVCKCVLPPGDNPFAVNTLRTGEADLRF